MIFECTLCGRKTNNWHCLGTVCLASIKGSPCPGMIDNAEKLARERADLAYCIAKYPNRYSTPDAIEFVRSIMFEDNIKLLKDDKFPSTEPGRRY